MVSINHQTREMNNRVFGDMYPLENIIFRSLSSRNWNYNTQRQNPSDKRCGGCGGGGTRGIETEDFSTDVMEKGHLVELGLGRGVVLRVWGFPQHGMDFCAETRLDGGMLRKLV